MVAGKTAELTSTQGAPMNVGEQLPEIELRTAEGEPVPLSRYVDRPTVIQLLRYYG